MPNFILYGLYIDKAYIIGYAMTYIRYRPYHMCMIYLILIAFKGRKWLIFRKSTDFSLEI